MKKIIALSVLFSLLLVGCTPKPKQLEYEANLGYDYSKVNFSSIVFTMYETVDHQWTKIHEFTYNPNGNHGVEIKYEEDDDKLIFKLCDTWKEDEEDAVAYNSFDIDTYEYVNKKANGALLGGYANYPIYKTNDEQNYRLYTIGDTVFGSNIDLNQPFDEEDDNIANILITVKINQ